MIHLRVWVAGLRRTAPPGAGLAFLGAPKGGEDMTYIAPHDICRDADGNIVDCDRPQGAFLLVAAGGHLPIAEARKYGLVQDDDAPAASDEKSVPQAPEDKSVKSSANKSRRGGKAEAAGQAVASEASSSDALQSDQAADSDEKSDGE